MIGCLYLGEERDNHDATSSTNRPTNSNNALASSQPEQQNKINTNDDVRNQLYEMIREDLDKFVFTTIPKGMDYIQCRITRAKGDIYWLHAEHPSDGKKVSNNRAISFVLDKVSYVFS